MQIKVDTRQIERYLKRMPKQVPFAISTALNATAKDVRTHIVRRVWPRSVTPKKRGFAGRAFRMKFANKRNLLAAVYADPSRVSGKGIDAISQLETGARHYPYSSTHLAIPQRNALTRGGRLNALAKRVLARAEPNTFVKDYGRGPAIWLRTKRGMKMMFVLKPSVPSPRVFPFGRAAERKARDRWQGNIRKSVIRAVKSAR